MRIGIDLRLPTYQMGGISQYALHLIPALANLDGDHTFLIFHSRKERRNFLPDGDGRFLKGVLWTPCHHRWERWSLGSELWRFNLDVLHSPDFIPPKWGAARKVITIHDLTFLYYPQFLTPDSRRYYLDQIQWAAETADYISADSEATRQDILAKLGIAKEKVTTIHLAANPIYSQAFSPQEIAATLGKYGIQPGFILFVGTLEPRKNLPMLIRATKRLNEEKGVKSPLILIGSIGWQAGDIFETISKLNLENQVIHLQGIYDRELAHFYHAAGVLVTPSYYEGFGLPALEAQHCRCPVVVSNRGSLPEIVGSDGIMLDPDDSDRWVETLARVLEDESLRQEMIVSGLAQAGHFSWHKTAVKTLRLYEGETNP